MSAQRRKVSGAKVVGLILASAAVVGAWVIWSARRTAAERRERVVEAISARPDGATELPADPARISAVLESALEYARAGKAAEAGAIYAEAARDFAGSRDVRVAYGEFLASQRRLEESYAQYEAALAIGPREPAIEFAAGTVANTIGRPERALEHYTAAQTGDPSNARYPLFLALVQNKLGKTDDAKVSLLRVVKMKPDEGMAWGTLADIMLRENAVDLALQHIAEARRLQPEMTAWRVVEARALKRKGKPREALDVIAGIGDAEKREPGIARLIGECYGLMGEKDRAAEWLAVADAAASSAEPGPR